MKTTESELLLILEDVFEKDSSDMNVKDCFKDYDEWDSLTNLSLMAMVDSEYNVKLNADEIKESETLLDLFTIIKSKQ